MKKPSINSARKFLQIHGVLNITHLLDGVVNYDEHVADLSDYSPIPASMVRVLRQNRKASCLHLTFQLVRMALTHLAIGQLARRTGRSERPRWIGLAPDGRALHKRDRHSYSRRGVFHTAPTGHRIAVLPQSVTGRRRSDVLHAFARLPFVPLFIWSLGYHHR